MSRGAFRQICSTGKHRADRHRCMWADYYEKQGVTYAFFSAFNAAAAQEQAERMWRREHDLAEEAEDEEDKEEDDEDEEEYASGEEVETESESSKPEAPAQTDLDGDYEEGWSTEGEDDEGDMKTVLDDKMDNGDPIPMREVVADVNERAIGQSQDAVEDRRTRVLSVVELEDLFVDAAPDLSGTWSSILLPAPSPQADKPQDSHLSVSQNPRNWSLVLSDIPTSVNRPRSTPCSDRKRCPSRPPRERPSISRHWSCRTTSPCAIARVLSSLNSP